MVLVPAPELENTWAVLVCGAGGQAVGQQGHPVCSAPQLGVDSALLIYRDLTVVLSTSLWVC